MEPNKNKNMWMWVVVVALVVLAIIMLMMNKKNDDVSMVDDTNGNVAMDADDKMVPPEGTEDTSGKADVASSPSVTLSYAQALEKYKDRRIQFTNTCSATPNTVTYKDNTGIMLDNRSAETRTIKVGSTYTVKGYGFKIITLPNITTQKTFLVDCDGQQNVATILVQE